MKHLSSDQQLKYLTRLGLDFEEVGLTFLKRIVNAHVLRIHYENLDLFYGIKVLLDVDVLFRKIIINGRGGYSLELNTLLYHLLHSLGFPVQVHEARFVVKNSDWSEPFSHQILRVMLDDQPYLIDIGQPHGIANVLKVQYTNSFLDYTTYFKFSLDHDQNLILEKSPDSLHFHPFLWINENPSLPIEFIPMHDKYQLDIKSVYRQKKLLYKKTASGYVELHENEFTFLSYGKKKQLPITDSAHFQVLVYEYFGVDMRKLFE